MSEQMNPEGSLPDGEATQSPADQGGSPWLKMVPKETAEKYNDILSGYDSFNTFVQSSIESMNGLKEFKEKYDGAAVIPGENATEKDWEQVWARLRPEDASEYGLDEEALASIYHNANLSKAQAEKLSEGLVQFNEQQASEAEANRKKSYDESLAALTERFGDQLEPAMKTAQAAIGNLGGEKLVGLLQQKGLDNDPQMIEFFFNVGSLMQEGNLPVGHKLRPKANGLVGTYTTMEGIE